MEKTALERVLGYIAAREARPLRGGDDCSHGLHAGEDFEGYLNYSDLTAVMALLHDTVAALENSQRFIHDRFCDPHPMGQCEACLTAERAIAKATGKEGV